MWREWIAYQWFGNSLLAWAAAAAVFAIALAAMWAAHALVRARLAARAAASASTALSIAAEVAQRTGTWFLFVAAAFVASRVLAWPARIDVLLARIAAIALLLQLALWGTVVVSRLLAARRARQLVEDPSAVAAIDMLAFGLRAAVWSIALLLALDNLGVDVTALIAGLGIGGVAVALAAQNILGDLFASLSIVVDKPFVVGDFIVVGEYLGTVEHIGLKTTRIRSLSGEQLVFSNNDLLGSRIRNYGRMYERRVVFSIGVTYQTPLEKLHRIPRIIREAIEAHGERVRFDRAHFQRYGDFALVFEAVYYVRSPDYNVYMDVQQAINLTLYERFAAERIDFAYPTQTVYLAPAPGAPAFAVASSAAPR